jgi:hypothetical protein
MKIISLFIFLFLGCQADSAKKGDNLIINGNDVKISYINFSPKKVDKDYLGRKIEELFKIIEISRRESPNQLDAKSKFKPRLDYKITEHEVKRFKGLLLSKRHISTKGNHEWKEILDKKHIVIENEKLNIFIIYPLEESFLIIADKPFEKIQNGETILVRYLKNWIDIRKSFKL